MSVPKATGSQARPIEHRPIEGSEIARTGSIAVEKGVNTHPASRPDLGGAFSKFSGLTSKGMTGLFTPSVSGVSPLSFAEAQHLKQFDDLISTHIVPNADLAAVRGEIFTPFNKLAENC